MEIGECVPEFSLRGSDEVTYSPKKLLGRKWVIYFYPKDMTPGCTTEACDFTNNIQQFLNRNMVVLGVSGGTVESKVKFVNSSHIGFPLLADTDFSVAKAFGAWGQKKRYGITSTGLLRSTFLIDEKGRIQKRWSDVKVAGHVDDVLSSLSSLEALRSSVKS